VHNHFIGTKGDLPSQGREKGLQIGEIEISRFRPSVHSRETRIRNVGWQQARRGTRVGEVNWELEHSCRVTAPLIAFREILNQGGSIQQTGERGKKIRKGGDPGLIESIGALERVQLVILPKEEYTDVLSCSEQGQEA